jgi:hypothetical protein
VRFRVLFNFGLTLCSTSVASPAFAQEAPESPAPAAPAPVAAEAAPVADLPPPSAKTTHIVAGLATTAVSYGLALGASYLYAEEDFRGSKDLRIPVVGPWMALGKTGCPTSSPDCSTATLVIGAVLTIIDGVAQAGGLGIVGEGLFLNTSSAPTTRKAELGPSAQRHANGPTVRAVPMNFGKDGAGLGFVGTF